MVKNRKQEMARKFYTDCISASKVVKHWNGSEKVEELGVRGKSLNNDDNAIKLSIRLHGAFTALARFRDAEFLC
jgi:hypothetical protein